MYSSGDFFQALFLALFHVISELYATENCKKFEVAWGLNNKNEETYFVTSLIYSEENKNEELAYY